MERSQRKTRIASRGEWKRTADASRNSKDTQSIEAAKFNKITEDPHVYKEMVDLANHGFVITDMKGNLLYVNDSFARMHGYKAHELIGKNLKIFHNAKQLKYVRAVFDRLKKTGKGLNNEELWRKRRDGTVFPTLTNNWLLMDKSGQAAMLCATMVDISESRKQEAELAASKKTLQAMLNASGELILMMDRNGNLIEMNKQLAAALGQPRGKLIGRCAYDFIPPKVAAARRAMIEQVMATGKPITFYDDGGRGRVYSTTGYPLKGLDGKVTGVVAFSKDVTRQKKAEADLEESKKTLETMLNASGELIAMLDRDINFIDANEQMANAMGLPREKLVGRCAWDFIPPKVAAARRLRAKQVIATGKPITFFDDGGRGRFFSTSYYPLKGPDGNVTGMVVFAKDVTQQKKAEAELEAGKKTLETMLNASGDSIAMVDRNFNFIEMNEQMADSFGRPREKLIGRCAWDCMPPKAAAFRRPKAEHILATGKPVTYFDEDDRGRIYSTTGYPLKGPDGKVTGIVVFAKDITQHKKAETELSHYREELFKLRRSAYLDLFGAVIGHELSQPLTIINLLMEEMACDLEIGSFEKEKMIESTKTCLREAKTAAETIHKMRKLTKQWIEGRIEHFSPSDVIREVVSSLELKATRAKMRIEVREPKFLPAAAGYRVAFEQIVHNLTENAIEAADQKKWRRLVIIAEKTDRHIEMKFCDDCRGIAKENLGKIFEPFYSTKTHRGGKSLGLGLPIIQRILTTMGGEIRVESAAGKGTTFYVNWPLK